jgi:hypothetical protein
MPFDRCAVELAHLCGAVKLVRKGGRVRHSAKYIAHRLRTGPPGCF